MAFYRNKVQKSSLIDRLVSHLTTAPAGATAPYWKPVQSGTYANEGIILHSRGKSGTDDIFVRFVSAGATHITMSIMEKYTPNAVSGVTGSKENESVTQEVRYAASGAYAETAPVSYFLSFDRDKIMLVLTGDLTANAESASTLVWMGLPQRMDPSDKTGAVFAVSRYAYQLTRYGSTSGSNSAAQCRLLKARNFALQPHYDMVTLTKFRTKGWGNQLFLPTIYLDANSGNSGVRGIMDGVYPVYQPSANSDFSSGDEITVGSKRYTVFLVNKPISESYNVNCFPSQYMAVEQLT